MGVGGNDQTDDPVKTLHHQVVGLAIGFYKRLLFRKEPFPP